MNKKMFITTYVYKYLKTIVQFVSEILCNIYDHIFRLAVISLLLKKIKLYQTRMTTSISSDAQRNQTSILIRGKKITFPPKPDGQTDIRMDGN